MKATDKRDKNIRLDKVVGSNVNSLAPSTPKYKSSLTFRVITAFCKMEL